VVNNWPDGKALFARPSNARRAVTTGSRSLAWQPFEVNIQRSKPSRQAGPPEASRPRRVKKLKCREASPSIAVPSHSGTVGGSVEFLG